MADMVDMVDMVELDPQAKAMLGAYRQVQSPDAAAEATALAAVKQRIAAGDAVGLPHQPDRKAAAISAGSMAWIVGAAVAVAAALALWWAATPTTTQSQHGAAALPSAENAVVETPAAEAARRDPPPPSTAAAVPPATQADLDAPEPTGAKPDEVKSNDPKPNEPVRRVRRPRQSQPIREAQAPTPASSLAQETALVGGAKMALNGGDPKRALRLLDEHARRFPRGLMAEERMLERARTLCALGRTKAARRQATTLLTRFPRGPLGAQARAVCVEGTR